eukprot:9618402-Ditylum_brightwellii.AAC.1
MEELAAILKGTTKCPTHVRRLVRTLPTVAGYCDAAEEGAGGCIFSTVITSPLVVWHMMFPADVVKSVISNKNPSGAVMNSDLELAAELLHVGVCICMSREWVLSILVFSDNSATVH